MAVRIMRCTSSFSDSASIECSIHNGERVTKESLACSRQRFRDLIVTMRFEAV